MFPCIQTKSCSAKFDWFIYASMYSMHHFPSPFPLSHISLLFPLSPILPSIDFRTVQPIALDLKIISKKIQFSAKRTRILMGFIFYFLLLIVNPMGRILVRWKSFKNNLEIQCHPICNRLYAFNLRVAPFWFKMYTCMHV